MIYIALSLSLNVAHVDDTPPLLRPFWYRLFSIVMVMVLVVVVLGLVGGVAYKHHIDRRQKRFF